ncbi:hypothetical protein NsoK4_06635 [Nitrosopumilus sp. K4]|uniref:hypothetical protein n=1 Tax=Nitrosopumilus sp. K4 TaxID=2795383 RepID=UPI001BA6845A|nr:hypothetical protein [Nitrosopumilus sp. K4]QUC64121.1 hypothetical protein NsoK4_06635 [Nitrosopumilus sp. K4]
MAFSKTCPVCKQDFSSLLDYTLHIKDSHSKAHPEEFVSNKEEIKWSFRQQD